MTDASDPSPADPAPAQETSEPPAAAPYSAGGLKALLAELESIALGLRQQAAESENGLGPGEARLLACLAEHGELTVPELARLRGTSRQNIQIMANRLAAEGCLKFNGNPAHKRSGLVSVTEQGRERLRRGEERGRQLEEQLAAALSGPELSQALELLQRIRLAVSGKRSSEFNGGECGIAPQRTKKKPRQESLAVERSKIAASESTPGLSEQPTDFGLPANLL